jgi:dTMP kinase
MISGIAYANQLEINKLIELNLIATDNNLPTHVILLELTPEELKYRLSQKENDSIELRGIDYLINIQNRMKETIQKLNINHIFIDASLKIEEIEKKIEDFINV